MSLQQFIHNGARYVAFRYDGTQESVDEVTQLLRTGPATITDHDEYTYVLTNTEVPGRKARDRNAVLVLQTRRGETRPVASYTSDTDFYEDYPGADPQAAV